MSYRETRSEIETWFAAAWTRTPIAWENVDIEPPDNAGWVRLSIESESADQIGFGSGRLVRHRGKILVSCRVPAGSGAQTAIALADEAIALLRTAPLSSHVLLGPTVSTSELEDQTFEALASVPFYRDEVA